METSEIPAPPPSLTWRDAAVPLLAVGLAAVFWAGFGLENMYLPHLGVLALVCAHFAAVLLLRGKRTHWSADGVFCLAASLALGASCALYASGALLVLNCFVILLTAAMATFSLSGQLRRFDAAAVGRTVCLSCAALFTRLDRPWRALGRLCRTKGRRAAQGALAIALAVPVLALVLWLLSSADAVFGSLLARFSPAKLPAGLGPRLLRTLILAAFLASALSYIREDAPAAAPQPERARHASLFLPVTALLDGVYIIFCYIQLKYLFGGAAEAAMAGGWAEYARTGFFQLAAVAAIDLGLCLAATDRRRFASRGGTLLRAALGLLLVLTAVILLSAFWRMRLYIRAFGMSVLRLLTLWAMAATAFGILAAAWKLVRPVFGSFRAAGGFALALWCLMCLANPAGMIARYNVDGFASGALPELDTAYLRQLGPDVLPALSPLRQAGPEGQAALDELVRQLSDTGSRERNWAQWSLSAYRAGQ